MPHPRCLFAALVGLVFAMPTLAADAPSPNDKLNTKIADVTLIDAAGKPVSLLGPKDKQGRRRRLPVVRLPRIEQLRTGSRRAWHKTYEGKGVAFLAINSSDDLDAAQIAKQAAEFKLPFPVLKDKEHAAADAFKAVVRLRSVRPRSQLRPALPRPDRQRLHQRLVSRRIRRSPATICRTPSTTCWPARTCSSRRPQAVGCPIPQRDASREDRQGDLLPRRAADPAEQLPGVPSARRGRAVLADDLQAGRQLGERHQGVHAAAARCRRGSRSRASRSTTIGALTRQGHRHARRLGRWRHAGRRLEGRPAAAAVHRRLAAGQARPGADRARGVDHRRQRPRPVPLLRAADDLTKTSMSPPSRCGRATSRVVHHSLNFFDTHRQGPEAGAEGAGKAKKADDEQDHGPGYSSSHGHRLSDRRPASSAAWAAGRRGKLPRHLPEGTGWCCPRAPTSSCRSTTTATAGWKRTGRPSASTSPRSRSRRPFKGMVIPGPLLRASRPANENFTVKGGIEVLAGLHAALGHAAHAHARQGDQGRR